MDQKKIPAGAREKLPFWFPMAWSTRAVALSMQMTMAGFMGVYFTHALPGFSHPPTRTDIFSAITI